MESRMEGWAFALGYEEGRKYKRVWSGGGEEEEKCKREKGIRRWKRKEKGQNERNKRTRREVRMSATKLILSYHNTNTTPDLKLLTSAIS